MSTKYKLKSTPIGKGSFATVFYATDVSMNEFAIKRIPFTNLDAARLDKFMIELDISVKLKHNNIVKCSEIFKTDTYWYIVCEYCNYGTFADLPIIFANMTYVVREQSCEYYLHQLKDALEYLHANNIIHRDLKPLNILLLKNDDSKIIVKLADFGLSRYFHDDPSKDMTITICGSPIYMSPELLLNGKYNGKADLWSFGVVMYELLYGNNPYNCPKNMTHLRELVLEQKIDFKSVYSTPCMNLLQHLLKTDIALRIDWDDFFKHKWFTHLAVTTDDDTLFAFDETKTIGVISKYEMEPDINEYINTDEHTDVKTYHETYSSSIIKILSDSISYLFGGSKSY